MQVFKANYQCVRCERLYFAWPGEPEWYETLCKECYGELDHDSDCGPIPHPVNPNEKPPTMNGMRILSGGFDDVEALVCATESMSQ